MHLRFFDSPSAVHNVEIVSMDQHQMRDFSNCPSPWDSATSAILFLPLPSSRPSSMHAHAQFPARIQSTNQAHLLAERQLYIRKQHPMGFSLATRARDSAIDTGLFQRACLCEPVKHAILLRRDTFAHLGYQRLLCWPQLHRVPIGCFPFRSKC